MHVARLTAGFLIGMMQIKYKYIPLSRLVVHCSDLYIPFFVGLGKYPINKNATGGVRYSEGNVSD